MEIHAFDSTEGILYVTDTTTVREHGILLSMHPAIGPRYHLPRKFWRKERLSYRVPFLKAERLIVAQDDDSSGVQLSLTL